MDFLLANAPEPVKLLLPWEEDILSAGMILLGAVLCLSGEALFNTCVAVIAGIAGGVGMNVLLSRIHADISLTAAAIIVLVASILAAAIASQLKPVGIWLGGALAGLLASNLVYTQILDHTDLKDSDWIHLMTVVVCAILGGTLLSMLERPLERLLTSFVGGYLVVAGTSHILKGDQSCTVLLIVWMSLFVLGAIWQSMSDYYYAKHRREYQQLS